MRASELDLVFARSRGGPLVAAAASRTKAPRITPPHAHARGQLFGVRHGVLSVTTDAGRWVVPATHAVWVPPDHRHGVEVYGAYDGYSVYVDGAACADLAERPFAMQVSPLLRAAIERAVTWGRELSPAERHVALVVLDEIRGARHEPLGLPYPIEGGARRIAELVARDLGDARTLPAIAKACGTTSRTAARHFAAETGFSFTQWRQRARVLASLERLAGGASVLEVALELGYDNASAFIAMFRRVMGETPGRHVASARRER